MNVDRYLDKYQSIPFSISSFNEIDAMIFASLSYPHYHQFLNVRKTITSKQFLKGIKGYDQSELNNRRKQYLVLLDRVFKSSRYKGLKILHYKTNNDPDSLKQFQAVTFLIKDLLIISFAGTDGTVVGFKEDLNMAFLDATPGEVEAVSYINDVIKKHPYKKIIVVGHSKGGRLAITASKNAKKADKIQNIYSFDAPNYQKSFYDDNYEKILIKIKRYAPEESIVGRLINEPINCKIVKSDRRLIMQHDTLSWEIIDNHFAYADNYSKRSSRIVGSLNSVIDKYDQETLKHIIDVLFDLADRLEVKDFTTKENNLLMLKDIIEKLPLEWKKTPKEGKKAIRNLLFSLIVDFIRE